MLCSLPFLAVAYTLVMPEWRTWQVFVYPFPQKELRIALSSPASVLLDLKITLSVKYCPYTILYQFIMSLFEKQVNRLLNWVSGS